MATFEEKIRYWLESDDEEITPLPELPELCEQMAELMHADSWTSAQQLHARTCRWCKHLPQAQTGRPAQDPYKSAKPGDIQDAGREHFLLLIEAYSGPYEGIFDDKGYLHLNEGFEWPVGRRHMRVIFEGAATTPDQSMDDFEGRPKPIRFARSSAEAARLAGKRLPKGSLEFYVKPTKPR